MAKGNSNTTTHPGISVLYNDNSLLPTYLPANTNVQAMDTVFVLPQNLVTHVQSDLH